MTDLGCVPRGLGLPVFSFGKDWSDFDDILFPYWSFINTKQSTTMYREVPWRDKVETALWRGSTTGGLVSDKGHHIRVGTWRNTTRAQLVAQCKNITDHSSQTEVPLCDAHFTGYVLSGPEALGPGEQAELEQALGGLVPHMPTEEHSRWGTTCCFDVLETNPNERAVLRVQSKNAVLATIETQHRYSIITSTKQHGSLAIIEPKYKFL